MSGEILLIFDVDGTLTPLRGSSTAPFRRELLPGVRERCAELRAQGHVLALVSNQGGAARNKPGRLSIGQVLAHLRWMRREIGASAFRFAINRGGGRYKPSPAMLLELMVEFGVDPADTLYVGDWESDRQAAQAAGCRFAWAREFFGWCDETHTIPQI